jgi:ABC-type multidrug transport system ATPase subunit
MTQRTSTTAVSFSDISISTVNPAKQLVSNVSGYVIRGGITAVLGPTASGKSLLMRALSGRVHNLRIQGDFFVEGQRVDCRKTSTPISYVSQDDVLIGDLSARETLYNNAAMKRNKPSHETDRDVKRLLDILGLAEVADNFIGTVFKRGLSGGQKKRVEIGAELVAAPLVLFLDEPTSGLDAFIAYDVLKSIHTIAKASSGKLSIVLSIHQPNSRILELIDHIMVLGDGRMTFFGTVQESIEHMSAIGFPLPRDTTPTDYFLHVSDRNFLGQSGIDFAGITIRLDGFI